MTLQDIRYYLQRGDTPEMAAHCARFWVRWASDDTFQCECRPPIPMEWAYARSDLDKSTSKPLLSPRELIERAHERTWASYSRMIVGGGI